MPDATGETSQRTEAQLALKSKLAYVSYLTSDHLQ